MAGVSYLSYWILAFRTGKESPVPSKSPAPVKPTGVLDLRGRIRPVQPGYSTGIASGAGAGTLCCIVSEPGRDIAYVLSADHVFSGEPGEPVLQPGLVDGGQAEDRIAAVSRKVPLRDDGPNFAAGAIARLDPGVEYSQLVPVLVPSREWWTPSARVTCYGP